MTTRIRSFAGGALLCAAIAFQPIPAFTSSPPAGIALPGSTRLSPHRPADGPAAASSPGRMWFEPNAGGHDGQVRFVARTGARTAFVTDRGLVLPVVTSTSGGRKQVDEIRLTLNGSRPKPDVAGIERLPGHSNSFVGADPSRWRRNVPHFGAVRYAAVYPGVDLVVHGRNASLEFDFVVGPGADVQAISFALIGSDRVTLDGTGAIVAATRDGVVRLRAPRVFQEIDGARRNVPGRFTLSATGDVAFRVGAFDPRFPLTIDPEIEYVLPFGGSNSDTVTGIAMDGAGAAYVVGTTASTDFSTVNPIDATLDGASDVFVAKILPDGSALAYATYLGGANQDLGAGIAVDDDGNAYVTGSTRSTNFPTTAGAFQRQTDGDDAWVVKLGPNGDSLAYATFFGGSDSDSASAVTLDEAGRAFVVGATASSDVPTMNAFAATRTGPTDAFLAVLDETGSGIDYGTYFGGSGFEGAFALARGADGRTSITGFTTSGGEDFPATPGALGTSAFGGFDAFVATFDIGATGASSRTYATFYGGNQPDFGYGIGVADDGRIAIAGSTGSANIPRTSGSFQPEYNGGAGDGFLAILNASGSAVEYGTYIGGSGSDGALGMRMTADGDVVVVGNTDSPDLPQVAALQPAYGGGPNDAFVFRKSNESLAPAVSSYVGGGGAELGLGVAIDATGRKALLGFTTKSSDFPGAQLKARIDPLLFDEAIIVEVNFGGCAVTCPSDIVCTVKGKATTAKVTYPDPTLSGCVGATCKPRKGSDFPVGVTIVTCEAASLTGETDKCIFKITVFEKSAVDDSDSGKKIFFNTSDGKYTIICNGMTFSGTATVTKNGGETTLTETTTSQKLTLRLKKRDDGEKGKQVDASFESPPGTVKCAIKDTSLKDSKQTCPTE